LVRLLQKTIEFGKNGGLACSARFDHIDSHFTGKEGFEKKDIKDWKSIELEPAETFEEILPQEPRPVIQTNHATDSHSRKRRHDAGTPSSQSKRVKHSSSRKDSNQSLIWFCVCLSLPPFPAVLSDMPPSIYLAAY